MLFMLITLERPYLSGVGEPNFFQVTNEWAWPKCQNAQSPIPTLYGLSSVWATKSTVILFRVVVLTIKSCRTCSTCVKSTKWVHIHTNVIWLFTLLKEHHFHASQVRLCANFKSRSQYHTLKAWIFSRCICTYWYVSDEWRLNIAGHYWERVKWNSATIENSARVERDSKKNDCSIEYLIFFSLGLIFV